MVRYSTTSALNDKNVAQMLDEIIQCQSDLNKIVTKKLNKNLENNNIPGIATTCNEMAQYLKVIMLMIVHGIANKYKQAAHYMKNIAQSSIMYTVNKIYVFTIVLLIAMLISFKIISYA